MLGDSVKMKEHSSLGDSRTKALRPPDSSFENINEYYSLEGSRPTTMRLIVGSLSCEARPCVLDSCILSLSRKALNPVGHAYDVCLLVVLAAGRQATVLRKR